MNRRTWYVFSAEDEAGGLYAYAQGISNNNNLTFYAKGPRVHTMNACDTKRDAEEIAEAWNRAYIQNGTAAEWLRPVRTA